MSRALGVEIDGGSEHFYTASKATLLNWFPVDCPGDIIRSNLVPPASDFQYISFSIQLKESDK